MSITRGVNTRGPTRGVGSRVRLYDLRGLYVDFDDRIYLQNSTFSAFLEKLGYKCNVDMQNLSVNIITQGN